MSTSEATYIVVRTAVAQRPSITKPLSERSLLHDEVEQLLLLIDTCGTGKVTNEEWMKFMELEFDRLDRNKSGVLDREELAQSKLRVSPFAKMGK